jgi:hypothetical protein
MAPYPDTFLNDDYSDHYDNSCRSQPFHYDSYECVFPNRLHQADVGYSHSIMIFALY